MVPNSASFSLIGAVCGTALFSPRYMTAVAPLHAANTLSLTLPLRPSHSLSVSHSAAAALSLCRCCSLTPSASLTLPLLLSLTPSASLTSLTLLLSHSAAAALSQSHPRSLTITCTCCYDVIKGTQDQDLFSSSFSDSLSLGVGWDEEDDGPFEPPLIENPTARRMVPNPNYKPPPGAPLCSGN